jgi:hypothetical protein
MRKVILSIVALAIASVAMAQDTGARKAVQVAQIPGSAAGANTGESIQNGSANAVEVRQAGTEQSTLTDQDGVANLARVMQTGDVNGNQALSGQLNLAEVEQTGFNNQSTIYQEGDFNNAMIDQNNDNDTAANRAQIMQGVADQAESNDAAIVQDGEDNSAYTLQTFDNSDASTVQDGTGNISEIDQNAGPEDSMGQFAIVNQTGNANESRVEQDNVGGSNARNRAFASQFGDNNKAEQIQEAEGSMGNRAQIDQGWDGSHIVSGTSFGRLLELTNFDSQIVNSIPNESSTEAVAFQSQSGDDNDGLIAQASSVAGSNNAAQIQDGNGNSGWISQSFYSVGGTENVGRQLQTGDDNAAALNQDGADHASLQDQWGDDNTSVVSQAGMGNNSNMFQVGAGSYGQTLQHGEFNVALLTQRDGQSYTIRQNEGVFAPGVGGNQADILQEGPLGTGTQNGFIQVTPQGVTAPHSVSTFSLAPIN